jgi:hypothetical protein
MGNTDEGVSVLPPRFTRSPLCVKNKHDKNPGLLITDMNRLSLQDRAKVHPAVAFDCYVRTTAAMSPLDDISDLSNQVVLLGAGECST